MVKINRVYTKGGDTGQTSLIGGKRVAKSDSRVDCYGPVDELNAVLGLVACALAQSKARDILAPIMTRVQNELFNLGAELATPDSETLAKMPHIEPRHIEALERDIDALNDGLPELTSFVLPGAGWVSSYLHLARTVCRRAERSVVDLAAHTEVSVEAITYLNRLSDACFVFSRYASVADNIDEHLWDSRAT